MNGRVHTRESIVGVLNCSQGALLRKEREGRNVDHYDNQVIKIKFSMKDCKPCPFKAHCTKAQRPTISVRVKPHHEALPQARARQKNAAFWEKYRVRSGIEGTISQGVRTFGMRRSRYRGSEAASRETFSVLFSTSLGVRSSKSLPQADRPHFLR
jgi:hypothetical protein